MLQSLLEGERNHMVALTAAGVMMLQMSLFIHTMRLESFAIALLSLQLFGNAHVPVQLFIVAQLLLTHRKP
jgi:hypothetical protein